MQILKQILFVWSTAFGLKREDMRLRNCTLSSKMQGTPVASSPRSLCPGPVHAERSCVMRDNVKSLNCHVLNLEVFGLGFGCSGSEQACNIFELSAMMAKNMFTSTYLQTIFISLAQHARICSKQLARRRHMVEMNSNFRPEQDHVGVPIEVIPETTAGTAPSADYLHDNRSASTRRR